MTLHRTRHLASAVVATFAFALAATASAGEAAKLYTSHNLWYEHPQKLASTGYQKGTLLPAGTEISDLDVSGKAIEFELVSTKMEMRIIFFAKHHPGITAQVFADRLFTPKDFAAITAGMTAEEVSAIRAGQVVAGMSRAAALVARGYPPESKTGSLESDVWSYQASRFGSELVRFKDGKVTLEAPPPPPEPAKVEAPKEPTKFLQYNLWFEDPEKLYSANYQTGTLLPAGTELRAANVGSDSISFTVIATNVDFEIEFNPKHHPGLPIEKLAERMIGDKDFAAITQGFSADEVEAIRAGEIRQGMTRAAVLVAAGHPPESKTSTINASTWTYFSSRYKSFEVRFKDGKVTLGATPPPEPAKVEAPKEPAKFLQYNLWFENPEKLYSANYQTGTLLPVGTELRAVSVLSDSIAFTVTATNVDYEIEFNPKHHPGLPIEKLAERMIGNKDFAAVTRGLSADEVEAIRAGEIRPGMTRAAVLVAAGHPPESKTSTLNASTWTYFSNRYKSFAVEFQKDKVAAVRK